MNTTILHRLVWKELRTLRALWLSLLAMAFVMQLGLARSANNPYQQSTWVFAIAFFLPVVYSLACAAMAFAGEREEGTDQLLCRLAAPPLALLSTKVLMNLLSTAALLAILYLVAWMLAPWQRIWDRWYPDASLASQGMLALAWGTGLFSWGLFFSLLFRRVMPCLILTTVAAAVTPLVVPVFLELLPSKQANSLALDWTVRLVMIPGLLLLVSSQLVQTWDENRWPKLVELLLDGWRRVTARRERLKSSAHTAAKQSRDWRVLVRPFGFCLPDESLPSWKREARRLLWLEWRSARRVMMFLGLVVGTLVVSQRLFAKSSDKLLMGESALVLAVMAFVFGVWSYQAQQSERQFRSFAGHGVSPVAMWLAKQGVWFTSMLLALLVAALVIATLASSGAGPDRVGFKWHQWFNAIVTLRIGNSEWWRVPSLWSDPQQYVKGLIRLYADAVYAVGLCFAVGQAVSLLIPRAVTASTVGIVLAGVAFRWQELSTVYHAIPSELAVLPLIVGLLLASFARMSDWMEERNSVRSWLKVVMACVVPSLVTLIGVPMYRVWEIPDAGGEWRQLLAEKSAPSSMAARQTAVEWLRVAESIVGDPVCRRLQRVHPLFPNDEEKVVQAGAGLFNLRAGELTWAGLQNREWVTQHAQQLAEAARLAREPDCAFAQPIFEIREREDVRGGPALRSLSRLAMLVSLAAEAEMDAGRLDSALDQILVLHRFSQHLRQHGGWDSFVRCVPLEHHVWNLLHAWARHPQQTGDSLREALGRPGNTPLRPLHSLLVPDRPSGLRIFDVIYSDYAAERTNLDRRWQDAPWLKYLVFWERLREERLLDLSVMRAESDLSQCVSPNSNRGYGELCFIQKTEPGFRRGLREILQVTTRSIPFHWSHPHVVQQYVNELGQIELQRRALLAMLALRAFQFDHGQWPTQLEELVGPYLDRLPVDPWTEQPMEFRPQGFPFDVPVGDRLVRAKTPLLLSGGPGQQHFVPSTGPRTGEEAALQVQWLLVSKLSISNWPPEKEGTKLTSIVCFPLNTTKP